MEQSSKPLTGMAALLQLQEQLETSLPWSADVNLRDFHTRLTEVVAGSLDVLQTMTKKRNTKKEHYCQNTTK